MDFFNNPEFYIEVGNRIRKYRNERNISQEYLAKKLSLTRTSITNIEKGRQKLLLHTLCAIAYELSIDVTNFLPFPSKSTFTDELKQLPIEYQRHVTAAFKELEEKL